MELFGFGYKIDFNMPYGSPMAKVSKEGENTAYYVSVQYDKQLDVVRLIQDVKKENKGNPHLWDILGKELEKKYFIQIKNLNSNKLKKQKPIKVATTRKASKPKEIIPQVDMRADYAKVVYVENGQVDIEFTNHKHELNIVTLNYRKSWSHKKYVNHALEKSGITPSFNFRYGWDMTKVI